MSKEVSINMPMEMEILLRGVFRLNDSGTDSKIFHSWKLDGILPNVPKGQMARLSFIDLVLLHILGTMRNFGCHRKIIKQVSNKLVHPKKPNKLYDIVTSYLLENNDVGLIIYLDGKFVTYQENKTDLSVPYLVIPLNKFIEKLMANPNIKRKMSDSYIKTSNLMVNFDVTKADKVPYKSQIFKKM